MNYEQLRCENCGASLSANQNSDMIFCSYCNTPYEKRKSNKTYKTPKNFTSDIARKCKSLTDLESGVIPDFNEFLNDIKISKESDFLFEKLLAVHGENLIITKRNSSDKILDCSYPTTENSYTLLHPFDTQLLIYSPNLLNGKLLNLQQSLSNQYKELLLRGDLLVFSGVDKVYQYWPDADPELKYTYNESFFGETYETRKQKYHNPVIDEIKKEGLELAEKINDLSKQQRRRFFVHLGVDDSAINWSYIKCSFLLGKSCLITDNSPYSDFHKNTYIELNKPIKNVELECVYNELSIAPPKLSDEEMINWINKALTTINKTETIYKLSSLASAAVKFSYEDCFHQPQKVDNARVSFNDMNELRLYCNLSYTTQFGEIKNRTDSYNLDYFSLLDVYEFILKELEDFEQSNKEKNVCQYCGGKFKGLFKKVCSKCGKEKSY